MSDRTQLDTEMFRKGFISGVVSGTAILPVRTIMELLDELDAAREKIIEVSREAAHWEANHHNQVRRAAILAKRPDLPIERAAAYHRMQELEAEMEKLTAEIKQLRESEHARCQYCDGTGDVHSVTGEWRGRRTCPDGAALAQMLASFTAQADGHMGLPRDVVTAWHCSNSVTGRLIFTDSEKQMQELRDCKTGHWVVTPLVAIVR